MLSSPRQKLRCIRPGPYSAQERVVQRSKSPKSGRSEPFPRHCRPVPARRGVLPRVVSDAVRVRHRYGDVVVLDGLDLNIRSGEVVAVLGPNGAGKTTAISLLLGRLRVQECARARVRTRLDRRRVRLAVRKCARARVRTRPGRSSGSHARGAMLQVSGGPDTLTVVERLDLFCSYYSVPFPISRLLGMAGLEGVSRRRYGRLSVGQKQW